MQHPLDIPEDFIEFLHWLKVETEAAWADYTTMTLADFQEAEVGGSSWHKGTKWQTGLTENQIATAEEKWEVTFPENYRQFLTVLNSPDRGIFSVGWSDEPPYGLIEERDEPSFIDWQMDNEVIGDALDCLENMIEQEVEENSLWLKGWGRKPFTKKGRDKKVAELLGAAPKLIPIVGNRYLLTGDFEIGNPVLSLGFTDIIYYAPDLQTFLGMEFSELLGLDYQSFAKITLEASDNELIAEIPFWGEIMLQGSHA